LFSAFGATVRFPEGYEEEKEWRNAGRDIIVSRYKTEPLHMATQLSRIKSTYPLAKYFGELLEKFRDEYTRLKREKNVIDFNDMEQMAYQILQNPLVANSYRTSFFEVYVDEYQDTSPIQEAIINSVSTPTNLFCVGDLKQSIYRFRSSDPILFKNRMAAYFGNASKNIISLNYNFRSSANVINCANDVFKTIAPYSSEISYNNSDELVHGRNDIDKETPVTIELIDATSEDGGNVDKEAIEIANIVKTIKRRLGKPIYDPSIGGERPAEYRDFAILSRKVLKYSNQINEIFTRNGIPFEIEKNGELLETPEVMTLVALLQLIINNNNDLNILTVMHQGVFGFTDDDIMSVRKVNNTASYIDNIKVLAESGSDSALANKCREFIGFLNLCCEKQHLYSLHRLISYVIDRAYLNDIFAVKENGAHRMDNLKLFTNCAAEYEYKNHKKLYSFLKYMSEVADSSETIGEARSSGTANAVKITTIHKSKGLEYPIVILAFMSTAFSEISKRSSIIIDRDAGVGIKFFDKENRIRSKNFLRTSIENKVMDKNKEEEMRLLYVAMTRAKEELYIQGIDITKQINLNEVSSMMEWVLGTTYTFEWSEPEEEGQIPEVSYSLNAGLGGRWNINFINYKSLTDYIEGEVTEIHPTLPAVKTACTVPSRKHIDKAVPIPKSVSASALDRINKYDRTMFAMPEFMTNTSAADKGDSVHRFLRYATLVPGMSESDVAAHIDELVARGTISAEDKANISPRIIRGISKMTDSDFFNDMMFSDSILKEKSLYTSAKSTDFIANESSKDMLVRCVVDIAYKTDEGYVVADYKTDNITEDGISEAIEKHKSQVETYSKCFEDVYGVPVVASYLVMLSIGQVVAL
jgi:ATP-dependent helicase/nuclease subunit A